MDPSKELLMDLRLGVDTSGCTGIRESKKIKKKIVEIEAGMRSAYFRLTLMSLHRKESR